MELLISKTKRNVKFHRYPLKEPLKPSHMQELRAEHDEISQYQSSLIQFGLGFKYFYFCPNTLIKCKRDIIRSRMLGVRLISPSLSHIIIFKVNLNSFQVPKKQVFPSLPILQVSVTLIIPEKMLLCKIKKKKSLLIFFCYIKSC